MPISARRALVDSRRVGYVASVEYPTPSASTYLYMKRARRTTLGGHLPLMGAASRTPRQAPARGSRAAPIPRAYAGCMDVADQGTLASVPASGEPLDELVDAWLRALKVRGRGLSVRTERAYRADLVKFATVAAELEGRPPALVPAGAGHLASQRAELRRVTPADFSEATIEAVLARLLDAPSPAAASSRARYLGSWRSFCRWLVRHHYLSADPTMDFDLPRRTRGLPVAFSHRDLARILEAARHPTGKARTAWPARDVGLLAVLAGGGLRAAEVCALTCGDLEWDRERYVARLRFVAKGGLERVVPVDAAIHEAIASYQAERRARHGAPQVADALFVRVTGRPLDVNVLDRLVRRWLRDAGVRKPVGEAAHAFRHTFAVGHVKNGTDVARLRDLLGHASVATTSLYLRVIEAELEEAVAAAPIVGLLRDGSHQRLREVHVRGRTQADGYSDPEEADHDGQQQEGGGGHVGHPPHA